MSNRGFAACITLLCLAPGSDALAREELVAGALAVSDSARASGERVPAPRAPHTFVPLPPVWTIVPQHLPEPPAKTEDNPLLYGFHALVTRRIDNALAIRGDTLARDINSLDEVPDSAWFHNRIGHRPLSAEDVFWGPMARDGSSAPPPGDRLTVVSSKEEGANPGFIAEDSRGDRYLVKFDPPGRPEMQSAADLIGNRLAWALGYHVAQDSIFTVRREELAIDPEATFGSGKDERPLTMEDIDRVLARTHRSEDGSYRVHLSRFVPGKPIGPPPQEGVRKDDSNDRIPHEDRRSLRGLRVFAAWVNHVDVKPGNMLDAYVTEDGKSFVRHYLIDFGEIFAAMAGESGNYRAGFEYRIDPAAMLRSLFSLGLYVHQWEHVRDTGLRGVGPFGAEPFRYEDWKPSLPNRLFKRANDLDEFWALRKLLALRDEHLRAAVRAGQLSDPASAEHLFDVLKKRRAEIAREILDQVNPADHFALADARTLVFEDLAVRHGLADATGTTWLVQQQVRGPGGVREQPPYEIREPRVDLGSADRSGGEQLVVRIQTLRSGRELGDPVHVHLDRLAGRGSLAIVGIDRWRTGDLDR